MNKKNSAGFVGNLPFAIVENTLIKKYNQLDPIARNTFMKYSKLMTIEVEKKVSNELPEKFGIVLYKSYRMIFNSFVYFSVFTRVSETIMNGSNSRS